MEKSALEYLRKKAMLWKDAAKRGIEISNIEDNIPGCQYYAGRLHAASGFLELTEHFLLEMGVDINKDKLDE